MHRPDSRGVETVMYSPTLYQREFSQPTAQENVVLPYNRGCLLVWYLREIAATPTLHHGRVRSGTTDTRLSVTHKRTSPRYVVTGVSLNHLPA